MSLENLYSWCQVGENRGRREVFFSIESPFCWTLMWWGSFIRFPVKTKIFLRALFFLFLFFQFNKRIENSQEKSLVPRGKISVKGIQIGNEALRWEQFCLLFPYVLCIIQHRKNWKTKKLFFTLKRFSLTLNQPLWNLQYQLKQWMGRDFNIMFLHFAPLFIQ